MKKYTLLFIVLLLPAVMMAQKFSNADKARISSKIDSLLLKYMQKGALSEQPNLKRRSEKMFKEYKNLFAIDAMIFDDINASYDAKTKDFPYKLEVKSRLDYFDGLADAFEDGLIIINKKLNISYDHFDEGIVQVALERQIEGNSYQGYQLRNDDTLLITVAIYPDKSVKIKTVDKISTHLKIMNDKDLDGVVDGKDECVDQKGPAFLNGCPDKDNDGIADKRDQCPELAGPSTNEGCPATTFSYKYVFSASAGYHLNRNEVKMYDLGDVHYSFVDTKNSDTGSVINPGYKGSFVFSANIAYYFGKQKQNKNNGISLGVVFSNYGADYTIQGLKYYLRQKDENGQNYFKIVNLASYTEKLKFNFLTFPLQFKWKGKLDQRWAYEFGAGVNFTYLKTNISGDDPLSKVESIFQNPRSDEGNYEPSTTDFLLVTKSIEEKMFQPSADTLYKWIPQQYGLHTLNNENFEEAKIKDRHGFGLIGSADLFYHVTSNIAIKLGGTFIGTNLKKNKEDYSPVDEKDFHYSSIFNSNQAIKYRSFGLNLGLILGI